MSHETTLRPKVPLSESPILRRYCEKTPGSARLHARAVGLIPDGITHVSRYLEPHPPFVTRAAGSRKWDVDGNEYVDYVGGHGSLLLGHNHPAVVEAVVAQLARGTHYGASHELELEWAEMDPAPGPVGERIRFTNSGTEATHLALRVARAATGKPMVVRFAGHFHGWHDHVAFSDESAPGIVKALTEHILISPPGDSSAFQALCNQRDDIAAVLIEPTGATFGQVPVRSEFLAELRRETSRRGIVLIFDEVISGFRCSPGGAQGFYGVTPDLTTLAKILAGGFPGGALVGRADLLSVLQHRRTSDRLEASRRAASGDLQRQPCLGYGRHRDSPTGGARRFHRSCQPRSGGDPRRVQRGHPPARRVLVCLRRVLGVSRLPEPETRAGLARRHLRGQGPLERIEGSDTDRAPAEGPGRFSLRRG